MMEGKNVMLYYHSQISCGPEKHQGFRQEYLEPLSSHISRATFQIARPLISVELQWRQI